MRTKIAYLLLLVVAVVVGYWYAGQTGAGPGARAFGAGANEAAETAATEPAPLPDGVTTDSQPVAMDSDEKNNVSIYRKASPAVVNITTQAIEFDFFSRPVPTGGSGSGFLVDKKGHIVTNNHVIQGAEKIQVTFSDGTSLEAEIVGVDPLTDIAVIRIDPGNRNLPSLTLGDSDRLQVGQKVLAIGNPFGLQGTLTTGVISALRRNIQTRTSILDEAIQTDAAINPGNSGGPLLDSEGRVIGVNTLIQSPSGGSVGVGFAVPVNTVKFVLNDLLEHGRVRRGFLGIKGAALEQLPGLVDYFDLPIDKGVVIGEVIPGSAAEKADLRGGDRLARVGRVRWPIGGDVIVTVDGKAVTNLLDLNRQLYKRRPGEQVTVEYYRGVEKKSVRVTLQQREDIPARTRRRRQ